MVAKSLSAVNRHNRHVVIVPLLQFGIAIDIHFHQLETMLATQRFQLRTHILTKMTPMPRVKHNSRLYSHVHSATVHQ